AGELEAAKAGGARTMERNRVRGTAAGDQKVAAHLDRSELSVELQDQTIEAIVGHQQVRAEAHRRDRQRSIAGPAEPPAKLPPPPRPRPAVRSRPRWAARGPDRRLSPPPRRRRPAPSRARGPDGVSARRDEAGRALPGAARRGALPAWRRSWPGCERSRRRPR